MKIRAFAADAPKSPLKPFEYEPGPLGDEHVEIAVEYCGVCHSDLSMLNNEWGITAYPFVPGHEVVGKVVEAGRNAKRIKVGQRVGLGWFSQSCMHCRQCLGGDHNLCPTGEQTIVGRHGGFANRVRCHWAWATPIPEAMDYTKAGPLLCGGITVFNPIVQLGMRPTQRVGVVGIGGLGHLGLQFLNKWGCDVVAFTSSAAKKAEALSLGAHRTVDSRSDSEIAAIKGTLDYVIVTANANLNWNAYIDALAPRGRLHFVGVAPEAIPVHAFSLISAQRGLSGSPLGSPATTADMLDFAVRHKINAVTEMFPMSRVNDALAHLESGKARYRVVLQNDLPS